MRGDRSFNGKTYEDATQLFFENEPRIKRAIAEIDSEILTKCSMLIGKGCENVTVVFHLRHTVLFHGAGDNVPAYLDLVYVDVGICGE